MAVLCTAVTRDECRDEATCTAPLFRPGGAIRFSPRSSARSLSPAAAATAVSTSANFGDGGPWPALPLVVTHVLIRVTCMMGAVQ